MRPQPLAFVVPGPLDQITGGYLYDRRIVEGLRATGRRVGVAELPGRFPEADATARQAAAAVMHGLPDGTALVIDGLALPAFADYLPRDIGRLRIVGLVHHPLALETGLDEAEAKRLAEIETWCLAPLRGVICPSQGTARAVAGYGVPANRIAVVPPGTLRPVLVPALKRRRAAGAPVRLLSVGTLIPRKGHVLLVEALATLTHLPWRLTIIGSLERDPPTVLAVRDAIARADLGHRIELAGEWPPDRLSAAYAASDLFVLPSFHEGYGMAYAEAMAHGLPVIGTTAGAIPDTVSAGAGMLVPPGDRTALRAALQHLLAEPEALARLAATAATIGAALPSWEQAARLWAEAFDRLAGRPGPISKV